MKILKWVGIVLVVLVAAFVIVGFLLPKEFHVERSVVIDAEPAQIHRLVGDLNGWAEWEPWSEDDASVVTTVGSPSSGVGARQTWTSSSGEGELIFTASDAATGVEYEMTFDEGTFRSDGALLYEAADGGTRVTWSWHGENEGLIGRYFGFMLDGMVGSLFQKGLDNLKAAAEALPAEEPQPVPGEETEEATGV